MKLTLARRHENAHDEAIYAVASSGLGVVVTGALDETVKTWKVGEDGGLDEEHAYPGHGLGVVALAMPDGRSEGGEATFAANALDSSIRVWDVKTHLPTKVMHTPPGESWGIAFGNDARYLYAAGGSTGALHVYDLSKEFDQSAGSHPPTVSVPLPAPTAPVLTTEKKRQHYAMAVAVAPGGDRVACAAADGTVALFDTAAGGGAPSFAASCEGHAAPVRSLCFVDGGKLLATACDDAHVHLYDARTGALVEAMAGHDGWAVSVRAESAADGSGSSRYLVSTGTDGAVKVWDCDARACIQTLKDSREALWDAAFVRGGSDGARFVVAAGESKEALVYRAEA